MLYERNFLDALPSLPLQDREHLPAEPGVYFILDATDRVLYVGRTVDLSFRLVMHHLLPIFTSLPDVHIAWYPCAYTWLDELEWDMMQRFTPPLNRNKRTSLCVGPGLRDANGGLSLAWWKRLEKPARYAR